MSDVIDFAPRQPETVLEYSLMVTLKEGRIMELCVDRDDIPPQVCADHFKMAADLFQNIADRRVTWRAVWRKLNPFNWILT